MQKVLWRVRRLSWLIEFVAQVGEPVHRVGEQGRAVGLILMQYAIGYVKYRRCLLIADAKAPSDNHQ